VTAWIEWFLGRFKRAIQSSEVTSQALLTEARFWESHAGKPFNGRQRLLLNRLPNAHPRHQCPQSSGRGASIVTGHRGFALILIRLIIFCIEFTVLT
jgi:hypothetical protein